MDNSSKYFAKGVEAYNDSDSLPQVNVHQPKTVLRKKPVKTRTKRSFAMRTYRKQQFVFNYKENKATISYINPRTNQPEVKLTVSKENSLRAARMLTRILELEATLDKLAL